MLLLLDTFGYRPEGFDGVEEAVQCLDPRRPPDLILADYRLRAGRTGIEAIQAVRTVLGHQVPALLITGDTSDIWAEEAMRHDVPVLRKPVNPQSLSAAILRALVPA